jgi:hypothetical protein
MVCLSTGGSVNFSNQLHVQEIDLETRKEVSVDVEGTEQIQPAATLRIRCQTSIPSHWRAESMDSCSSEKLTTVVLQNIPQNYTREMLLDLINQQGFYGSYDFIYVPMNFKKCASCGYAYLNLVSSAEAKRFRTHFDGFDAWDLASGKAAEAEVVWSEAFQGQEAQIERYRNSPVMHGSVPDAHKPLLFTNGERIPFPPSTKATRAPKLRKNTMPSLR